MPKTVGPKKAFEGDEQFVKEDWPDLEVTSAAEAPRRLLEGTWNSKVIGFTACRLSNDNERILSCSFHLEGSIIEPGDTLSGTADLFWDLSSDYTLEFLKLEGNTFSFPDGGLTSAVIDSSDLDFRWAKGGV